MLGIESQANADVFTAESRGCFPCPRGRDDQRGTGADSFAEGVVDADRGSVAEAEVGAVEDEQFGIRAGAPGARQRSAST